MTKFDASHVVQLDWQAHLKVKLLGKILPRKNVTCCTPEGAPEADESNCSSDLMHRIDLGHVVPCNMLQAPDADVSNVPLHGGCC
jgi:hypothetical protein